MVDSTGRIDKAFLSAAW